MADRVAVFNQGRIVQVGTPEDIYERPRTRFVADFVGGSNVLEPATVAGAGAATRAGGEPAAGEDRARRRPATPRRTRSRSTARSAQVLYQGAVHAGRARRPAAVTLHRRRAGGGKPAARPRRAGPRRLRRDRRSICMEDADDRRRARHRAAARRRASPHLRPAPGAGRGFCLLLLLVPPLLWLGVVYLGSLFALLRRASSRSTSSPASIVREFDAEDLWRAAPAGQSRHHPPHRRRWPRVGHRCLAAIIAFPIAYYAARYARGRMEGALLSRRHAAAVVELPGQGLCLEADPRQGRHRSPGSFERGRHLAWLLDAVAGAAGRSAARRCRSATSACSWSSSMSGCPS